MTFLSEKDPIPNKFTIAMGQMIQKAREEANLSQEQLSGLIFRRRETLSVIENGRSEVGAITLARIAIHTNKPLVYFFPNYAKNEITASDLSSLEKELILAFRMINHEKSREIAIKQLKILGDSE